MNLELVSCFTLPDVRTAVHHHRDDGNLSQTIASEEWCKCTLTKNNLENVKGLFVLLYVYGRVACVHVCICTACVSGARGDQTKALNTLELELWMAVSHHMGDGS